MTVTPSFRAPLVLLPVALLLLACLPGCHSGGQRAGVAAEGCSLCDVGLPGDLNGSGLPDITDAVGILRIIVGLDPANALADCDCDDAMGISDVLRGEEHLSNTPRQLLLYEALGYSPPRFGHLSLIVSPDGSKLSKRHGDTSIDYYAQEGYLPEAIVAYTATLGWAPGRNPERNSLEDLISLFSLRRLSSNPSTFDEKRMEWFNQRRLQRAERGRIADLMRPRLSEAYGRWEAAEGTAHDRETWYCHLVGAAQEEATTLSDMVRLCAFALASERPEMSAEAAGTLEDQWAPAVLAAFLKELSEEALATPQSANEWLTGLRHAIRDSDGLRGRQVMFPIRAALTGSLRGPCLGIVTSLLGQSRCRERVEEVLKACQPPL